MKAEDNPFPYITLVEQASTPATPASGTARLYRGTDNKQYIVDDTGTAIEVGAGGSGGVTAGSVLAFAQATAPAAYTTSSGTDADVDATNLAVTFTFPASGRVMVECSGTADAGAAVYDWTLRQGTTTVQGNTMGSGYGRRTAHFYLTGTPGASVTYKWGHRRLSASGTVTLYTGGSGGVGGNAMMRVTAMP